MSFVEIDIQDQIMIVKLNRPERLNALGKGIREGMADAFNQFKNDKNLEVSILTGEGRGFCAGEDMKESLEEGAPGAKEISIEDPFMSMELEKPVIAGKVIFTTGMVMIYVLEGLQIQLKQKQGSSKET